MVSGINTESSLDYVVLYTSYRNNKPKRKQNLFCGHCKMRGHEKTFVTKLLGILQISRRKRKKIIVNPPLIQLLLKEPRNMSKNPPLFKPLSCKNSINNYWSYWARSNLPKPRLILQVQFLSSSSVGAKTGWVLDTGAINHVTFFQDWLINPKPRNFNIPQIMIMPNGSIFLMCIALLVTIRLMFFL